MRTHVKVRPLAEVGGWRWKRDRPVAGGSSGVKGFSVVVVFF